MSHLTFTSTLFLTAGPYGPVRPQGAPRLSLRSEATWGRSWQSAYPPTGSKCLQNDQMILQAYSDPILKMIKQKTWSSRITCIMRIRSRTHLDKPVTLRTQAARLHEDYLCLRLDITNEMGLS
jgi:hypothetical protein